jgi:hypothetical protein
MANAVTVEIADAVVAHLNASALSQPFTAERSYLPEYSLEELGTLRVTVVASQMEMQIADRARDRSEQQVQVWVQQRIGQGEAPGFDPSRIDALLYLIQEINDLFRHKRLPGFDEAIWARSEMKPLYYPAHLKKQNVFTGVLTLTFSTVR